MPDLNRITYYCGYRECATSGPVGQMTIFYCGKVNVYDGVPPDKVGNGASSCMDAW